MRDSIKQRKTVMKPRKIYLALSMKMAQVAQYLRILLKQLNGISVQQDKVIVSLK